tara:strand:- start:51 stop:707 length:657 start_codon:yes stop_codon:yes gene_type:complete
MSKIIVDEIQTNTTNGNVRIIPNGTGVLEVDGSCTATTFSGSGASLTNLPAANLTGTLPAIDGSNLTGISTSQPAWFGRQDTQNQIPSVTWSTIVNLGDEAVNPSVNSGGWDESTGIFTVQSGQAGIYYAFGGAGIDDIQSDDIVRVGISKNDVDPSVYAETRAQYSESHQIYSAQMSQVFTLAVGDTLRCQVYHNEGSTEPTGTAYTFFGGFRIFAT